MASHTVSRRVSNCSAALAASYSSDCYQNYASDAYVKEFVERMSPPLRENNDMHESIDNYYFLDLIGTKELAILMMMNLL